MQNRLKEIADYCVIGTDPQHRLSNFERLTLLGGQDLDKALVWIAKQFSAFTIENKIVDFNLAKIKAAQAYYSKLSAETFFNLDSKVPEYKIQPVHGFSDGQILDLKFQSSYQPINPEFNTEYLNYKENHTVHARIWKHKKPAKATMIAIHGWTMGDQRLNALAFLPGFFYSFNMDVVMFELPYHGRRASAGASGSLFPSLNMNLTNEAMAQTICDLRQVKNYLLQENTQNIGLMGMSLGAYAASLWANLDRAAFCIPIVPLVSMAEIVWDVLNKQASISPDMLMQLSFADFQQIYAIHCPLNYKSKIDHKNLMIVAGLGDTIVPAAQPHILWEHWNRPRICWASGGHGASFEKTNLFYEMNAFLHENNFAELPLFCRLR